jgi:sugar O-acyltransferase (sialic acid O-acetyltransferase NeuD family)
MSMLKHQDKFHPSPIQDLNSQIYFVESDGRQRVVNGIPVISEEEFFSVKCQERNFNVAISDSELREEIVGRFLSRGAKPISLVSPNSNHYINNAIGVGAIICAYSTITSNAQIGKFFHCNIYSYVAHDCVIGNFVTFAPKVQCNGNVHVRDHAFIGSGAIIKQGTASKPIIIGEGATIGMGAVVTKDVQPHTTVIGNPARIYQRK